MGLETGVNHLADLVATNPLGTDSRSEGDDHVRNIKRALQASLPKMAAPFNSVTQSTGATLTLDSTKNHQVYVDTYAGAAAVTFPLAATVGMGFTFTIVVATSDPSHVCNATLSGSDTLFSTQVTYQLRHGTTATFISDGVDNWVAICGDMDFWKGYYRSLADTALQRGWRSLHLPISAAVLPASNFPEAAQTAGSNGITVRHYGFDASTAESLFFAVAMPQEWTGQGTYALKLKVELLWTCAVASGQVVWGVAAAAAIGNALWDIALGTEITAIQGIAGSGYIQDSVLTEIVPSGSATISYGDILMLRIRRLAADGNDTLAGDARLLGVRLYYECYTQTEGGLAV